MMPFEKVSSAGPYCDSCGWPEAHHRLAEEGQICPHQRKNKHHPRAVFAPREPAE